LQDCSYRFHPRTIRFASSEPQIRSASEVIR
jgi:hypothetical protein